MATANHTSRGAILWIGALGGDDAQRVELPSQRLTTLFQLNGWRLYAHPTIFSRTAAHILESFPPDQIVVVARQYIDSVMRAVKNVNTRIPLIYYPSSLYDPRFTTIYLASGCQLARNDDDLIQRTADALGCPVLHDCVSPRLAHLSDFVTPCLPSTASSGCFETVVASRTITTENEYQHLDCSKCLVGPQNGKGTCKCGCGDKSSRLAHRGGKDLSGNACGCSRKQSQVTTRTQTTTSRMITPEAVRAREHLAAQYGLSAEQVPWSSVPGVEKHVSYEQICGIKSCACQGRVCSCSEVTKVTPAPLVAPVCVSSCCSCTYAQGCTHTTCVHPNTTATTAVISRPVHCYATPTSVVCHTVHMPYYERWRQSKGLCPTPSIMTVTSQPCTTASISVTTPHMHGSAIRPEPPLCLKPCSCICVCIGPGFVCAPTYSLVGVCTRCCRCSLKEALNACKESTCRCACQQTNCSCQSKPSFDINGDTLTSTTSWSAGSKENDTQPASPCPCLEGWRSNTFMSKSNMDASDAIAEALRQVAVSRKEYAAAQQEGDFKSDVCSQFDSDSESESGSELGLESRKSRCSGESVVKPFSDPEIFHDSYAKGSKRERRCPLAPLSPRQPASSQPASAAFTTSSSLSRAPETTTLQALAESQSDMIKPLPGAITFSDCPQDPLEILSNSSVRFPFQLDGKLWYSVDHYMLSKMFEKAGRQGLADRIADVRSVSVAHILAKENLHLVAPVFGDKMKLPQANTREVWTEPCMRLEMVRAVRAKVAQNGDAISSVLLSKVRGDRPLQWRPTEETASGHDPVAVRVNAQLARILLEIRKELIRNSEYGS